MVAIHNYDATSFIYVVTLSAGLVSAAPRTGVAYLSAGTGPGGRSVTH